MLTTPRKNFDASLQCTATNVDFQKLSKTMDNRSILCHCAISSFVGLNSIHAFLRARFRKRLKCNTTPHTLGGHVPLHTPTYICHSQAGRSVLGKTVPEVSCTARGRRPRAVLETEGTVFPNTYRPRLVNNIFIYF